MILDSTSYAHQYWKDIRSVTTTIVSYGNYEGGDLILWQAKCMVQLGPGDAILFIGNLICYENTKITREVRNSIDLFTHKSNIDWIKEDIATCKQTGGKAKSKDKSEDKLEVHGQPCKKKIKTSS